MRLRIPESGSLKDKRQLVRSLTQRIRNKFEAAVAEVGDNEAWQVATIGVAVVANTHRHCEEVLDAILAYARESRLDAEILDAEREIIPFEGD